MARGRSVRAGVLLYEIRDPDLAPRRAFGSR